MKKPKNEKLISYGEMDKTLRDLVEEAASHGEITTWALHKETGAMVPIRKEVVHRLQNGETMDLQEAERVINRYYFKVKSLSLRWKISSKKCLELLVKFDIPFFFNPNQVPIENDSAHVGVDDVCAFQEYVFAIEKKLKIKIKDRTIEPEFIGDFN